MPVIFKTGTPIEAQLLVARLSDEGIPATFINEAEFILGFGSTLNSSPKVSVPDEAAERAREIFDGSGEVLSLPDDPEFDTDTPQPPIPPLEFSFLTRRAFWTALVIAGILVAVVVLFQLADVVMVLMN